MAMVFLVCPGCFQTTQTLAIGADKPGSTISITDYDKINVMSKSEEKKHTVDAPTTVYTMQCTKKQHTKPTEGIGATVT